MTSKIKNNFWAQVLIQSIPFITALCTAIATVHFKVPRGVGELLLFASIVIPARILLSRPFHNIIDYSLVPAKKQVVFVVIAVVLGATLMYILQGWRWDTYTRVALVILACMFVPVVIYAWFAVRYDKRHEKN